MNQLKFLLGHAELKVLEFDAHTRTEMKQFGRCVPYSIMSYHKTGEAKRGAMVVSGKTKYPDETVKFLDFMFKEENAKNWYENSKIPPLEIDVASLNVNPLFKEVVAMANTPAGLSYNIDVLMPQKVNSITQNAMQELIAGKKTGADVVKLKQQALEEEIAAGNY